MRLWLPRAFSRLKLFRPILKAVTGFGLRVYLIVRERRKKERMKKEKTGKIMMLSASEGGYPQSFKVALSLGGGIQGPRHGGLAKANREITLALILPTIGNAVSISCSNRTAYLLRAS